MYFPGCGFKDFWNFDPYLGKSSNLTHIFQLGWSHQLVLLCQLCCGTWFRLRMRFDVLPSSIGSKKFKGILKLNTCQISFEKDDTKKMWKESIWIYRAKMRRKRRKDSGVIEKNLQNYETLCWVVVSNIFGIFTPTWGRFPFWLIFFKWVGSTTN